MVSKSGNGKRLTGSQLGYRGKGIPDPETIATLRVKYCDALVTGEVLAEIRAKVEHANACGESVGRRRKPIA
jgi:hypothetical protein